MVTFALAGALQRMIEVVFQAAPTILVGLVVAGILRYLIGYESLRRGLGGSKTGALFKAWVAGMLLPVCSLGILPVIREMRLAGVSGGTILAFALTAPLFNPISVLYGLTLSDPFTLLVFCLGSLTVVTVLGALWDRLMPEHPAQAVEPVRVPHGLRRILAVGVASARESVGSVVVFAGIALVGVAGLALVLPHGRLQEAAEYQDPTAPAFMALVAIPAYAAPMTVMMQIASMFQHGNSIGAAFSLLVLGAGMNAGLIAMLLVHHRFGRTVVALGSLVALVVVIAYSLDRPLYPDGVEAAGHTHAFDGYCNPFTGSEPSVTSVLRHNLAQAIKPFEWVSAGMLAVLMTVGAVVRIADREGRLERWLASSRADGVGRWDVVLPDAVIGGALCLMIVAASIGGSFLYYPHQDEIFEELKFVHAEVFSSTNGGDLEATLHWIPQYEDWTRKLVVSNYLRGRPVSEYQRMKVKVLLDRLELLEHEAEDAEHQECRELVVQLNLSFNRLRGAFATSRTGS